MKKLFLISLFSFLSINLFSYETFQIKKEPYTITYYLKKPQKEKFAIMVCLQGSTSRSVALDINNKGSLWNIWNTTIQAFKDHYAMVTIEKPGVTKNDIDEEIYEQYHTLDNCASDAKKVLKHVKKNCDGWNGNVIVLGGSMGVDVASKIMHDIPELQAGILLSGVSNKTFEEMLFSYFKKQYTGGIVQRALYYFVYYYMKYKINRLRKNKAYNSSFGGYGSSFWRSMLDYANGEDIKKVSVPLLILQGEDDTSSPVEGFDAFIDECKKEGRNNITYKRYEGLGHALSPAVVADIKDWLETVLT